MRCSPFIERYWNESWVIKPGGIPQQSWQAQLLELEHRLNASTADWKVGQAGRGHGGAWAQS